MASGTAGIGMFRNHLPVRIRFGDGVASELPSVAREVGATRVLVMTDTGLEDCNAAVVSCLDRLSGMGIELYRHVRPPGEPTPEVVDAVSEVILETEPEAIVAVGGGSVIDAAKAGRVCAQLRRQFRDLGVGEIGFPEPTVALIAMPTTAGTGSEVSGGAVISDASANVKAGIAHPHLRPQYAMVDPVLTHSMPPRITAYSGIDAVAQAISGMMAKVRTPIGDALALEALRLAGRSLVVAHRDGSDVCSRSEMACASLMAGLTMNISDCTAEHSLGQALGATSGAPHGLTVGLVLAETLERERRYVPDQLERVADALGMPRDGSTDGSRAIRAVRQLLTELRFPVLSDLGVGTGDLDQLTALTLDDFFITQSPHTWDAEEVRETFLMALSLTERHASPL